MKIRLTGLPAEVADAAARLAGVLRVLETSRPYPRRGNSALVSLYLDITLDTPADPPAAAPGAHAAMLRGALDGGRLVWPVCGVPDPDGEDGVCGFPLEYGTCPDHSTTLDADDPTFDSGDDIDPPAGSATGTNPR